MDLMAFVTLANQLPSQDSIVPSPETAQVPTSAAALCMVVFRTLGSIDKSWVDKWMTYFKRLDTEAQGMFVNGVRAKSYGKEKQACVMKNKQFTEWSLTHTHLYSADQL